MARTTETMQKLYEFLKARSSSGGNFSRDQVVAATGYAESSIKAYVSKGFLARWVDEVARARYRVKNFQSVGWSDFTAAMSQNEHNLRGPAQADDISTESKWADALEHLLNVGYQRGYALSGTNRGLIGKLKGAK